MKHALAAAVCAIALVPQLAHAGACEVLEAGSIPLITDFTATLEKVRANTPPKDEYETTETYSRRIAAAQAEALGGVTEMTFAWKIPSQEITYNADTQQITITPTLFKTCSLYVATPPANALFTVGKARRSGNYQTVCLNRTVSVRAEPGYTATNALGAQVNIDVEHRLIEGVFVGMGDGTYDPVLGYNTAVSYGPLTLASIFQPPEGARSFKENGTLLIVARPRAPFYFASRTATTPTFDQPHKIFRESHLLVADVACTAVIDAKTQKVHRVLWDKPSPKK